MAADVGSVSWASNCARAGSRAASAAAGSSITATSIMPPACYRQLYLSRKFFLSVGSDRGVYLRTRGDGGAIVATGTRHHPPSEGLMIEIIIVDTYSHLAGGNDPRSSGRRLAPGGRPRVVGHVGDGSGGSSP